MEFFPTVMMHNHGSDPGITGTFNGKAWTAGEDSRNIRRAILFFQALVPLYLTLGLRGWAETSYGDMLNCWLSSYFPLG